MSSLEEAAFQRLLQMSGGVIHLLASAAFAISGTCGWEMLVKLAWCGVAHHQEMRSHLTEPLAFGWANHSSLVLPQVCDASENCPLSPHCRSSLLQLS